MTTFRNTIALVEVICSQCVTRDLTLFQTLGLNQEFSESEADMEHSFILAIDKLVQEH